MSDRRRRQLGKWLHRGTSPGNKGGCLAQEATGGFDLLNSVACKNRRTSPVGAKRLRSAG